MLAVVAGVILLLIAATPYILSLDTFRTSIESKASEALGVPVTVESHDFSWFRGVTLAGMTVANPPGFDPSHPALMLDHAVLDVSLLQLVRGRFDISGTVDKLVVHVEQDGEGRTNLQQLGSHREAKAEDTEDDAKQSDLSHIRLDVQLNGARIDITRDGRLLESMRSVDCVLAKSFDDADVRLELSAELQGPDSNAPPGALEIRANLDLDRSQVDAKIVTSGLDLERYQPVVAMFLEPNAITELAGVLNGNLDVQAKGSEQIVASGEMIVDGPRLSGALVQGMTLSAPSWKLLPIVRIQKNENGESVVETEGLAVDLGFCQLRGLAPSAVQTAMGSQERGIGIGYSVDLAAVTAFGGPIPELLQNTVGQLEGTLALPWAAIDDQEPLDLLKAVRLDAQLAVPSFGLHAFELSDLKTRLQLADGKLSLSSLEGTTLNTGALSLNIGTDLAATGNMPVSLKLNWKDGKVKGQAAELLRYGVPLLAGLGDSGSFQSGIGLNLDLNGPIAPKEGQTILDWLQLWTGQGDVRLANGSFSPTDALKGLLAATGAKSKLDLDELATRFRLRNGWIESEMQRFVSKGAEYGLTGRTGLDGTMDWKMDLSAMLKGHKDGEKILAALKGSPLTATVAGTVDAPALAMPDLAALVQQGVEKKVQSEIQKGLEKGLDKILRGGKKDDKTKKGAEDIKRGIEKALGGKKVEDELKRGLEKLLGGRKKK